MIVFGIAVVQLVHASAVQFEPMQQPRIHELLEGSIDRGARNVVRVPPRRKLIDQLVGVKVGVTVEYLLEQEAFLLRIAETPGLQKLLVASQRSHRNSDRFQRNGIPLVRIFLGNASGEGVGIGGVRHGVAHVNDVELGSKTIDRNTLHYNVVSADRSLNSRDLNYHKEGFEKSDPWDPDGGEQGPNEPLHSIAKENLGLSLR